jgi:hypothetical protein
MTVHVLGNWDISYHAPITEQYYWSFPMRDFGVDSWNMMPVSGIKNREYYAVDLYEWENYDGYFEAHPDLKRVFLEPRTDHQNPDTIWLHEFDHPEDCVYITGSAHYNPTLKYCREGIDDVVTVKTAKDNGVLWGDQVICITLYDRMVKSWQSQ